MDQALMGSSCPFQNYAGSLAAFARAIYGLRLQGERCSETGLPEGCGLVDPKGRYASPEVTELHSTGFGLAYSCKELLPVKGQKLGCESGNYDFRPTIPGLDLPQETPSSNEADFVDLALVPLGIPSSFGMDFIEIALDLQAHGRPLLLEFQGESDSLARFQVEFLLLLDGGESQKPLNVTGLVPADEIETTTTPDGQVRLAIRRVDLSAYNRIGLIIVRLDDQERLDPVGKYRLTMEPGK
jgi:hypothetical protein